MGAQFKFKFEFYDENVARDERAWTTAWCGAALEAGVVPTDSLLALTMMSPTHGNQPRRFVVAGTVSSSAAT